MNTQPNTATQSRPEEAVDPVKTAKFLANLQRTVGRRDPDDQPAPAARAVVANPIHIEVAEPVMQEAKVEAPTPPSTPAPKRKARSDSKPDHKMQVEVTLDPGTASRVVYIRVDKTLADRLAVIAFQNKINGGGAGPATINDIGISALNRWLDEYEQAA